MHHVMNRLDGRGHGPIAEWDDGDAATITKAAAEFLRHGTPRAQGGLGHTMYDISPAPQDMEFETEGGQTVFVPKGEALGRLLDVFDPAASEILAVPQLVGG
jgi:hypothetical protein